MLEAVLWLTMAVLFLALVPTRAERERERERKARIARVDAALERQRQERP